MYGQEEKVHAELASRHDVLRIDMVSPCSYVSPPSTSSLSCSTPVHQLPAPPLTLFITVIEIEQTQTARMLGNAGLARRPATKPFFAEPSGSPDIAGALELGEKGGKTGEVQREIRGRDEAT